MCFTAHPSAAPTALLPYCPTALLPYCPTALLPYSPTPLLPYSSLIFGVTSSETLPYKALLA
ncbi:hypothetical protein EN829_003835 [Mesorhizobium sp. M00.F.Ca.ET.186.01.1.1]|nr:hypothetical protein EN848_12420 [bacterium M00.F.Ca.ET.205.01.1.1]TGU55967.1 hypothetical protein EN795_00605 [bacterium M00.F.Ca.ET.152.01.1.1]TGV40612.1 hypothetical protein EN829_003835 [Mesorhizobium sp. M00.F.Ca.ET.186.01.1.1]TGZ45590.1 hypothetical protein EN805_03815 [bacterium M00.F.Ca.ET.162.01.1.1]